MITDYLQSQSMQCRTSTRPVVHVIILLWLQDERLNKVFQPQTKKASSKKQQPRSAKSKSRSAVATLESSEDPSSEETSFQPLPEFFDSDLSDIGEFLGFPPEAVVNDIQSKFTFDFQLNDRGKELFGEESSSDTGGEFKGFTLDDL